MIRVKFLIGYTRSFVFGETLNKWTISFHSRAKTTDLNNNVETCCQDFRLPYRYRFDNRTKYVFVGGSFEHSNAESRWPMHVQDTDHSAFLTNTYSYRSHYITWSENLNFCTSNVCTFGSYIMFDTINNIPWFPVSVSRSRRIILFSVSFCSVLEGECLNIRAEHFPEWILRLVWKLERLLCSSRIDVHFAETRTPYSPNEGILFTCHDWGLLSARLWHLPTFLSIPTENLAFESSFHATASNHMTLEKRKLWCSIKVNHAQQRNKIYSKTSVPN